MYIQYNQDVYKRQVKGNRSAIETRSIPPISNVDNVEIVELVEE